MKFEPKTEAQIIEERIAPCGVYDYEITRAEEAQSKKGNDMIKLQLKVYREDGTTFTVFDYLLEAMPMKLVHFCRANGLMAEYDGGYLTSAHCEGRSGKVRIDIQDGSGGFAAKNIVEDYLENEDSEPRSSKLAEKMVPQVPFDNDEIPY